MPHFAARQKNIVHNFKMRDFHVPTCSTIFDTYADKYLAYVQHLGVERVFILSVSKHEKTFEAMAREEPPQYNVTNNSKNMKTLPLYHSHPVNVIIHQDSTGRYRVETLEDDTHTLFKIELDTDHGLFHFGVTKVVEDRLIKAPVALLRST